MNLPLSEPVALRGLYAVTPETPDSVWLLEACEAVLAGGCRLLQYRDKTASPDQRLQRAAALRTLTHRMCAALIINDHLDLALEIGADGLHLGAEDGHLAAARERLGPQRWLGASCYADLQRAAQAAQAGVDYLAFGAMFASPTKPAAPTAPPSLFQSARTHALPLCAIGGITLDNAPTLMTAGADLLAVISDLFRPEDSLRTLQTRAHAYQSLFQDTLS